jgi:hypothetical protein
LDHGYPAGGMWAPCDQKVLTLFSFSKEKFWKFKARVKVLLRPTVQSASLSWNKAPIWGLRPDLYYCQTVARLLIWGALSDERTSLSFARLSQQ